MIKRKIKLFSYLFIAIILTFGLSLSLQSILAGWQAPTDVPPNGNVEGLINTSSDHQTKVGTFSIGGIASNTLGYAFRVLSGKVGIGITNPNSLLHLKTPGENAEIDIQSGDKDHWGIYHDYGSEELRFWNGDNRVVIEKDGNIVAKTPIDSDPNNTVATKGYVDAVVVGGGVQNELISVGLLWSNNFYANGGDDHYCKRISVNTQGLVTSSFMNYGRVCYSSQNYTCEII